MGLTRFPHGISSFGVPVLGGMGFGFNTASTIYFVDGANGSDSYDGKSPERAFATVRKATDTCTAYDVIYIAPKGTPADGEPGYYLDTATDPSITYDKPGVAIVGVGHSAIVGMPYEVCLKAYKTDATATECPCLAIFAPFCAIENLGFNRGNGNIGIMFDGDTATRKGYGGSVYNCYFRNVRGSGATGDTGGAIYVKGGAQNTHIERCMFYNTRVGIAAKSGTSGTEGLVIRDVTFRASAVTNVSADIYLYFQGQNYTIIDLVRIGHDAPTYSGGHGVPIIAVGGAEVGLISRVFCVDANGTSHATTGTVIRVPATMGCSEIYDGDNNLMAVN